MLKKQPTPFRVRLSLFGCALTWLVMSGANLYAENVVWSLLNAADQGQNLTDIHVLANILLLRHILQFIDSAPIVAIPTLAVAAFLLCGMAVIVYTSLHHVYKHSVGNSGTTYPSTAPPDPDTVYSPGTRSSEKGSRTMVGNTPDLEEQLQKLREDLERIEHTIKYMQNRPEMQDECDDDEQEPD